MPPDCSSRTLDYSLSRSLPWKSNPRISFVPFLLWLQQSLPARRDIPHGLWPHTRHSSLPSVGRGGVWPCSGLSSRCTGVPSRRQQAAPPSVVFPAVKTLLFPLWRDISEVREGLSEKTFPRKFPFTSIENGRKKSACIAERRPSSITKRKKETLAAVSC